MTPRLPKLFAIALAVSTYAIPALALDGSFRQSPIREDFTEKSWLPSCGPAPASGSRGGGETVTIKQDGDELVVSGAGRVYKTTQCYDELPTLVGGTHAVVPGKSWQNTCATPANDPRRASVRTIVSEASDTHLEIREAAHYETTQQGGACVADVIRYVWFDRIVPPGAASPSATPAVPPSASPSAPAPVEKRAKCDPANVGAPAKLYVTPSRKLAKAGESFAYQAAILDAAGCPTDGALAFSIDGAGATGVTVDAGGRVTVAPDAHEGTVDVVVVAAGKSARVKVDVARPEHYDALLAESGLNADGADDSAAVATLGTGSLGADGIRADAGAKRRTQFLAAIAGLAFVFAGIAAFGVRRSKRAKALEREATLRHEERVRAAEELRQAEVLAHDAQMREHLASVERAERIAEEARAAIAAASVAPVKRGKICPRCGARFDGSATFCGADGTALVLLN